jgi:hypothetical protein
VAQGAAKLLRDDRPVVLSELHPTQLDRAAGATGDGFLSSMRGAGYRAHLIEDGRIGAPLDRAPVDALVSIVLLPV